MRFVLFEDSTWNRLGILIEIGGKIGLKPAVSRVFFYLLQLASRTLALLMFKKIDRDRGIGL